MCPPYHATLTPWNEPWWNASPTAPRPTSNGRRLSIGSYSPVPGSPWSGWWGRWAPAERPPPPVRALLQGPGTRKAESLGLGLYVTRMLVQAHESRIWAESEVGKASTFSFTLPVAD